LEGVLKMGYKDVAKKVENGVQKVAQLTKEK